MKNKNNDSNSKVQYMPIGMCIGLSVGMAIGSAVGNIGVGMCLGLGIGLCFGSAIDAANNKKATDDQTEENAEK